MKKISSVLIGIIVISICFGVKKCELRDLPKEEEQDSVVCKLYSQRESCNAMYHWKTVFDPTEEDWEIIKRHNVKRLYVKMFDVEFDKFANDIVPVATTKFIQKPREGVNIVPCVYITVEAIKNIYSDKAQCDYAHLIVTRILNMMDYNDLGEVKEIQFDCDWTNSTRHIFYSLCEKVKEILEEKGIIFGVTIRLHQLTQSCPPAHYGLLMLYNTGGIKLAETHNSILAYNDVKPYLNNCDYALPLDFAYPAFSWNVWFRDNKFQALISEIDVNNTNFYKKIGENRYEVLKDHECSRQELKRGDVIRNEKVDVTEVLKVKKIVEKAIKQEKYSVAIYHLSSKDLKKMKEDEINKIYKMD